AGKARSGRVGDSEDRPERSRNRELLDYPPLKVECRPRPCDRLQQVHHAPASARRILPLMATLIAEEDIHATMPVHRGEAPPQPIVTGVRVPDIPARCPPHLLKL